MTGDPTQTTTELLIDDFRQRFPLLEKIVGEFGDDGSRERIPWFFGFLLAAANNPNPGGCCFVLDISTGTTAIAALLTALSRLKADFPGLVQNYARHAFTLGQRVRVLPSDAVFEYDESGRNFQVTSNLDCWDPRRAAFEAFPLWMSCASNRPTGFGLGVRAPATWVNAHADRWTNCSTSVPAGTTASFATSFCVTCRGYSSRARSIPLP